LARRFFLPLGTTIEHYSRAVAEKIEQGMTPIIDLFVPVFFVMVGVSLNLRLIDITSSSFWWFAGSLSAVAVLSKMASGVWVRADGTASYPRAWPWCRGVKWG
jgi:Kef-type K+ transport system membrane component KefB